MAHHIEKMLTIKGWRGDSTLTMAIFSTPEAVFLAADRPNESEVRRLPSAAGALDQLQKAVITFLAGFQTAEPALYQLSWTDLETLSYLGKLLDHYSSLQVVPLTTLGQLRAYSGTKNSSLTEALSRLTGMGLVEGGVSSADDPLWLAPAGKKLWEVLDRSTLYLEMFSVSVTREETLALRIRGNNESLFLFTSPEDQQLFIRPVSAGNAASLVTWAWAATPGPDCLRTEKVDSERAIRCPTCHIPQPAGSSFCRKCGSSLSPQPPPSPSFCGFCGVAVSKGERFCGNCGKPL